MKKPKLSRQVRISLNSYETLRRVAFKLHKPMGVIIDELIAKKV